MTTEHIAAAMERLEQQRAVLGRDADAAVGHGEHHLLRRRADAELHRLARRRILHGIGQQVAQDMADQALVDGVEYVDTSKYEQYEKQEGDFTETVVDETVLPAEATVPPDDTQS